VVRERSGKNIIFGKSGKMIFDLADCRYVCFFVSPRKAGKFAASIIHPKASGGKAPDPPTRASVVCILLHEYCFISYDIQGVPKKQKQNKTYYIS